MGYFSPGESIKKLEPVIDEYLQWFLQVSAFIFYPDKKAKAPLTSDIFTRWIEEEEKEQTIAPEMLERVKRIYQDLKTQADRLMEKAVTKKKVPEPQEYQSLSAFFDEFIKAVRRIEQDCLMDGYGFDFLTGMRSEKMLLKDINDEIDRLKRHGRNFCVALVKIDNFDAVCVKPGSSEEKTLQETAHLILKGIRSFDDAYRLQNGMFIVTLKQTELFGGMLAFERIKELLEEKKLKIEIDDQNERKVTLTCCVAQPMKLDEASVLIKDLERFLEKHKNEEGAVLKFYEMTSVQKFLKEEHGAP